MALGLLTPRRKAAMSAAAAQWQDDQEAARALAQEYGGQNGEPLIAVADRTIEITDENGNKVEVNALSYAREKLWLPTLEKKLVAELRELERDMTPQSVNYPGPGGVPNIRTELVDERAEAAFVGADEAVKQREQDLRDFARAHTEKVAVEVAPRAAELRRNVTAWLRQGYQLAQEEQKIAGLMARLLMLSDREALIATLPQSPFQWMRDAPQEGVMPLPEAFWR